MQKLVAYLVLPGEVSHAVFAKGTLDVAHNGSFQVDSDCSVRFVLPAAAQVVGVQVTQTLLEQVWPLEQVPQSMASPQPSEMGMQFLP